MTQTDLLLRGKATTIPSTHILIHEADATYAVTERLFHRVPDSELLWIPATGTTWMTVGQLLMHCASFGCGKAVRGFVKGDWGMPGETTPDESDSVDHVPPAAALPSVESVAQALELLASDRSLALNCIASAGEANLLAVHSAAPWGAPSVRSSSTCTR